jgi:hypothetical protein
MTDVSTDPMRLRSPQDVLVATPYLLGFHPRDSLVALGLRGSALFFHVRSDLPPLGAPPDDIAAVARHLADLFQANRVTGVLLVGFGSAAMVTPLIRQTRRAMHRHGISVRDMLRAEGGRYWSYVCPDPTCCPPEGTPYDADSTAVAAAATLAGCVALPSRDAVVREFDPPAGPALVAIERATDRAAARLAGLFQDGGAMTALVEAGRRATAEAADRHRSGDCLGDDQVAWLTLLVQTIAVRDDLWLTLEAAPRDELPLHEAVWSDLLRRCDPSLAAPVGMLLAFTLWRRGEGPRASAALDRALAADPAYSGARLMEKVLVSGVPPGVLAKARRRGSRPRSRGGRRRRR